MGSRVLGWTLGVVLAGTAWADGYRLEQFVPSAGGYAFVGVIDGYATAESAADYYDFTGANPDLPPDAPTLVSNRSHLFVIESAGSGVCLVFIHDRRADELGGAAETRWTLIGDANGADWLVQDGIPPADDYAGGAGDSVFAAAHEWPAANSDGGVIGSLNGCWSVVGMFTDFGDGPGNEIVNLESWAAYSPGDITLGFALEADRPVRVAPVLNPDINANGVLDFFDVLGFLQSFGSGSGMADFARDGTLDFFDILRFLEMFSDGCP